MLESISGVEFPRGENMCTRVPCIVSLEVDEAVEKPFAVLATCPSYKENYIEVDLDQVGKEVTRLTEDEVSPDGKVVDKPIYVKIVRERGPVLTLMDLPGITANSPDQDDIEQATTDLTKSYVEKPEMIVLVVVPAPDDWSNSKVRAGVLFFRVMRRRATRTAT